MNLNKFLKSSGAIFLLTLLITEPANSIEEATQIQSLRGKIEQEQKFWTTSDPEYLNDVSTFMGAVSTVWSDLSSKVIGTGDLKKEYDELFNIALGYRSMATSSLITAERLLAKGDIIGVERHLGEYNHYKKMYDLSIDASILLYQGDIDSSKILAEGIYNGSKAAVKFGVVFVSPQATQIVDGIFDLTTFAIDTTDVGLNEASKRLLIDQLTKFLLNIPVKNLDGKTVSQALEKGTTKVIGSSGLYQILDGILQNPESKSDLMRFIAKSGAYGLKALTEKQLNKIIYSMQDRLTNPNTLQGLKSYCGSGFLQKILVPEFNCFSKTGISPYAICAVNIFTKPVNYTAACATHDSCYERSGSTRSECDLEFKTIMEMTCDETLPKPEDWTLAVSNCKNIARLYYEIVRYKGGKAFVNAQKTDVLGKDLSTRLSIPSNETFSSALIIDRSGSMKVTLTNPDGTKAQKLESAKQAARAFILTLNENSNIAISTFSNNGNTVLPLSIVPNIRQTLDQAFAKINASGGTNIGAGLDMGFIELQKANLGSSQTALLLSDGQNNQGNLWSAVDKYTANGWPVCTIGFGKDADETTLRKIASDTGCTYAAAETFDIVSRYQELAAYAKAESSLLSARDLLSTNGQLLYEFVVSQGAEVGTIHTHWPGSMLKTILIAPDGSRIEDSSISPNQGRYVEDKTFQMLEINNPVPGKWRVELRWKDAPPTAEQVNILVTEKNNVFVRMHGLKSNYSLGQTVDVNTDAFEVVNNRKIPLQNASVKIEIKKPGEEVVRLIQAQSTSWTMYKDVLNDIRRDVTMFDDGGHSDYKSRDGVFGGSYTETDKNGLYMITATITGKKKNGEAVQKTIINTFQVGSIMNNPVSASQTMHFIQQAEEHIDDSTAVSTDLLQQPLNKIESLQQGNDPLDEINKLLQ